MTWRQSLDATTPGLSNALHVPREASTITSVDQILGDPVMRNVVTTALGIPLQIAFQDLDAQEQAITSQLDITQLPGPEIRRQLHRAVPDRDAAAERGARSAAPSLDSLAVQAGGLVV